MIMPRMKAMRLHQGWSQQKLAFNAEMSASDVSKIETGRLVPSVRQKAKLAQALGLAPEELLQQVALVPELADVQA
jgi:transcriptional regulator with XRE-family HTH domain